MLTSGLGKIETVEYFRLEFFAELLVTNQNMPCGGFDHQRTPELRPRRVRPDLARSIADKPEGEQRRGGPPARLAARLARYCGLAEDHAEVVGRHRNDFCEDESCRFGGPRNLLQISDAPFRITRT